MNRVFDSLFADYFISATVIRVIACLISNFVRIIMRRSLGTEYRTSEGMLKKQALRITADTLYNMKLFFFHGLKRKFASQLARMVSEWECSIACYN